MGEVWAAQSVTDEREVAIKVLREKAARDSDIVARFRREAKIASRIRSLFVCALLGTARTADGQLALVFERLRGESLADRLKTELYLPFSEVAPLMDDVLQGIADAHAAGVLHRDLKPGNIFIVGDGDGAERGVVLDFGVSKIVGAAWQNEGRDDSSLTAHDDTVGSIAYMAPEQGRGAARVDARADIYGIAAVAFRALTGRHPFEGAPARQVLSIKQERSAPALGEVTGEAWPRLLERFISKCLARDPADRFESAADTLHVWRKLVKRMDDARSSARGTRLSSIKT